jgi:hypothetical protein
MSPSIRFSGYSATPDPQLVNLHLPGHQQADRVEVEYLNGGAYPLRKTLKKDPHQPYWRLSQAIPKGTHYRFLVDGKPELDWLETVEKDGTVYNRVATEPSPTLHGSMLDVFQHSLRLDKPKAGDLSLGQTTHFNQRRPSEAALFALVDRLPAGSVRNLLLRPVQQGGYWTENPYVLDPTNFTSRDQFRAFLDKLRQKGIRLYLDTALVNQGLQGPQYLSNLHYGLRSPYWDWFVPTERVAPGDYPHNAYDGFKPGVLPIDAKGEVNWQRVALDLHNVPGQPGYQPQQLTILQLRDPAPSGEDTHSFATVQPYRFPVNAQEAAKKLASLKKAKLALNSVEAKQQLAQWSNLSLVRPSEDDSGYKWDGQIDVAKMNIDQPDAKDYLKGSVAYWTRFVTYHQTQQLARALHQAKQHNPQLEHTPDAWVKAIAGKAFTPVGHGDKLSWSPPLHLAAPSANELANTLLTVAPVSLAGQNWVTQAVLGHPELSALLQKPSTLQRGVHQALKLVTSPLKLLGLKNTPSLEPFKDALARQLSDAVAALPEADRQLLSYGKARDMAMFSLGEKLWETLVLNHGISQHIDPNVGAVLMAHHLTQGIHKLPKAWFIAQLKKTTDGLDINSLSLADTVVNAQELGPHLRIDAAKDVGNMAQVRHLPPAERAPQFLKETDKAVAFWQDILKDAKQTYPKLSVIAELTDIVELAGNPEVAQKAYQKFNTVFTSTPNMDHLFGLAYQSTHHSPSPQEFGDNQRYLGTSKDDGKTGFVDLMRQRAQSVPLPAQLHFQNMVSSHDYATASHNLLHNPTIATQDKLPYWGLENDLSQTRKELEQKPAFADTRRWLKGQGVSDLGRSLYLFEQHAEALFNQKKLSPDVMATFRVDNKSKSGFIAPTPSDIKVRLVDEVMEHLSPKGLDLPDEAAQAALANVIKQHLTEPSESRAMRATLNNAWKAAVADKPDWQALTVPLFKQVNRLMAQYGAHAGYQPLDLVLDRVINAIPEHTLKKALPEQSLPQARLALKNALMDKALPPTLDKLLRVLALQVGSPGIPSVYLHDFYPPGGGETMKNGTVQDRSPIALHQTNPLIAGYQKQALWLLSLRQQYPALDNGLMLEPANDQTMFELSRQGVMPFIRDNGKQQVILLVNTGSPAQSAWGNRVGDGTAYDDLHATQPVVKNLNLNLWHLGLPQGTRYRDEQTGTVYHLDKTGRLVNAQGHGPTVKTARLLVRV